MLGKYPRDLTYIVLWCTPHNTTFLLVSADENVPSFLCLCENIIRFKINSCGDCGCRFLGEDTCVVSPRLVFTNKSRSFVVKQTAGCMARQPTGHVLACYLAKERGRRTDNKTTFKIFQCTCYYFLLKSSRRCPGTCSVRGLSNIEYVRITSLHRCSREIH